MRRFLYCAACTLLLSAGCARQMQSPETIAALSAELRAPKVAVDSDCIFSAPMPGQYIAYRIFGLCMFSGAELRLYHGGAKPALAYSWPVTALKSWAFHGDTFTIVTEVGNFGLVLKDASAFIAVLRANRVPENDKLPIYRARDTSPFNWM